jgi:hypothetical protein
MTTTAAVPRTGPCSSWIQADDILARPECQSIGEDDEGNDIPMDPAVAAMAAGWASEILYNLSGQQFTGACGPVTVRPVSRPVDQDTRGISGLGFSGSGGYLASWGSCTAFGSTSGAVSHYGCSRPPDIELGAYPVTQILLVKIDGVVIPPNEYYLQDYRKLIRSRVSASATPTERWGWPVCQLLDLPDTEVGTFSVEYMYGVPPPTSGVMAATVLGAQLALNASSAPNSLPTRITSISRQGVSMMVVDVMDFLKDGLTGLYEVDLFLRTVNPSGMKRKAIVFSPDMGAPKRMPPGFS